VERLVDPAPMVDPLARVVRLASAARRGARCGMTDCVGMLAEQSDPVTGDLVVTLETTLRRARTALLAAAGIQIEATAPRELLAVGDALSVTITLYNQGRADVALQRGTAWTTAGVPIEQARPGSSETILTARPTPTDSTASVTLSLAAPKAAVPWWLASGRRGDVFIPPDSRSSAADNIALGEDRLHDAHATARVRVNGVSFDTDVSPIVYRYADPAHGERRRPVVAVPAVSVLLDNDVEYARAGPFDRTYRVRLRSAATAPRSVSVALTLPASLRADSTVQRAVLDSFGTATLAFRVHGKLPAGRHVITAVATSGRETFTSGYLPISYEHIRPLRYYRAASVQIEAVDAALPPNAKIAYIPGVGDNVAPMLSQLGVAVTTVPAEELGATDLSRFGAVVVGPRAFAASPALGAQAGRLQDYARAGGTVVVQYGQQEMQKPGILPYPLTLGRPAQRVTDERATVRVLNGGDRLLAWPNRVSASDFDDWVQERAIYMPSSFDSHYRALLEMHDPGEPPNEAAVLVAPVGKGTYVYTTLAFFRQLPAGVPGAARLFLNLLAAGAAPHPSGAANP
jgi:hypothetical protein